MKHDDIYGRRPPQRMREGRAWQYSVAARLTLLGWDVAEIGQVDVLPRWAIAALEPIERSALRYQPDQLVGRPRADGSWSLVAIDPKYSEPRTGYPIEQAELDAHCALAEAWALPIVYVFADWRVLSVITAFKHGRPGPATDNGSGTPYVLVGREHGRDFDAAFGTRR